MVLALNCAKNPVLPEGDEIQLIKPKNGSIITTTQPFFDWYPLSGITVYRVLIFSDTDTVVDDRVATDEYTVFRFIASGEYKWKIQGSKDGRKFDYSSPTWRFTLQPSPFKITSVHNMPGPVMDILYRQNHLFLACNEAGVVIVNATNMNIVTEISTFDRTKALDLDTNSNSLFVADYRGNIVIYDISNVEQPHFVNYLFARRAVDIQLVRRSDTLFAIVADEDNGVVIFSSDSYGLYSQRGLPFSVGGYCNSIYVLDTLIFAACNERGIKILSWNNPDSIYIVGELDLPGNTMHIMVDGQYCYAASGTSGLFVIDISDISRPRTVYNYNPGLGNALKVGLLNEQVVLAAGTAGLLIFTGKFTPTLLQQLDMPYTYSALTTPVGKIIAGDRDWGLVILE